jgi:(E)-4-hydroxy-3-methylbut-2-enyl-diphosphate synthase
MTLRGENIAEEFVGIIDDYVGRHYAARSSA